MGLQMLSLGIGKGTSVCQEVQYSLHDLFQCCILPCQPDIALHLQVNYGVCHIAHGARANSRQKLLQA